MVIYILSALVAIGLLTAHLFGLDGYYFLYDWYDVPMHMIGGLALGLLVYQLSHSFKHVSAISWKKIILVVICIGVAWELFEAFFGIAGAPLGTKAYYIDTVKDLINDTFGAFVGIGIASLFNKHKDKNEIAS